MIQITPISPQPFEPEVNLGAEISVAFSEGVKQASIIVLLAGERIFFAGSAAPSFTHIWEGLKLRLKPNQLMTKSQILEVDILAEDSEGNPSIINYVFRTTQDDRRPEVIGFAPPPDSILPTRDVPIFVHVEDDADLDYRQILIRVNGDAVLSQGIVNPAYNLTRVGTGRGYKISFRKKGGFQTFERVRVLVEVHDSARNFLRHAWEFHISARGMK